MTASVLPAKLWSNELTPAGWDLGAPSSLVFCTFIFHIAICSPGKLCSRQASNCSIQVVASHRI